MPIVKSLTKFATNLINFILCPNSNKKWTKHNFPGFIPSTNSDKEFHLFKLF